AASFPYVVSWRLPAGGRSLVRDDRDRTDTVVSHGLARQGSSAAPSANSRMQSYGLDSPSPTTTSPCVPPPDVRRSGERKHTDGEAGDLLHGDPRSRIRPDQPVLCRSQGALRPAAPGRLPPGRRFRLRFPGPGVRHPQRRATQARLAGCPVRRGQALRGAVQSDGDRACHGRLLSRGGGTPRSKTAAPQAWTGTLRSAWATRASCPGHPVRPSTRSAACRGIRVRCASGLVHRDGLAGQRRLVDRRRGRRVVGTYSRNTPTTVFTPPSRCRTSTTADRPP
ncbi:MAG: hypothetical protein QOI83_1962, partial [Streptomycetaceae bacterium]|nr:hypothetical protein [Streptomycetaceae bacterium]